MFLISSRSSEVAVSDLICFNVSVNCLWLTMIALYRSKHRKVACSAVFVHLRTALIPLSYALLVERVRSDPEDRKDLHHGIFGIIKARIVPIRDQQSQTMTEHRPRLRLPHP